MRQLTREQDLANRLQAQEEFPEAFVTCCSCKAATPFIQTCSTCLSTGLVCPPTVLQLEQEKAR